MTPHCGRYRIKLSSKGISNRKYRYAEGRRIIKAVQNSINEIILFFELGVGYNTPVIIKYPFWQMTAKNPVATYACIDYGEAVCSEEIVDCSI